MLNEQELLNESKELFEKDKQDAKVTYEEGLNLKATYQNKVEEAIRVLEHAAGLTEEEAKEVVLKKVEEKSRADIAHIVRKYEEEAKRERIRGLIISWRRLRQDLLENLRLSVLNKCRK